MKTESVFISAIKREVVFYIGKNQQENFNVIDMGSPDDLWFHAKHVPSCHVVCEIPDDICKNDLLYIIKTGIILCKSNTNKIKNIEKVEFIYTQLKNITKTKVAGCVITKDEKTIIL